MIKLSPQSDVITILAGLVGDSTEVDAVDTALALLLSKFELTQAQYQALQALRSEQK